VSSTRAIAAVLALVAAVTAPPVAHAQQPLPLPEVGAGTPLGSQVQHLRFSYGPLHVPAGGNLILLGPVTIEKPAYDGYMTRFKPDLVRADGSVPPVDAIHLHHGVWLNLSAKDATTGGAQRFAASGEEKTIAKFPPGFGYPVKRNDVWAMNYMLHNQTPVPENVWITYEVDYVPAASKLGASMKPVRPIWMDVDNGSAYPVFDVKRGTGGDGRLSYPDEVPSAPRRNEWTVDRDGTLIWAAGHVHPGGLWTDLDLTRGSRRQRLFRSDAEYFDPNGPVSWDMAMTATPPDWRAAVKRGDKLRIGTTYETQRASWYESMGIVIAYMADGEKGPDPFESPPQTEGKVTHGPLPENRNKGGADQNAADPRKAPDGQTLDRRVGIAGFSYLPGNQGMTGGFANPPVVERGKPLSFHNLEWGGQIFHTVTACKPPCNRSTGISYPLADGDVDFDSGELGYGPRGFTAAANRESWTAPSDLDPGTYTYFCRVHPFMRGSFRVK
jgi:hypothetical protein